MEGFVAMGDFFQDFMGPEGEMGEPEMDLMAQAALKQEQESSSIRTVKAVSTQPCSLRAHEEWMTEWIHSPWA